MADECGRLVEMRARGVFWNGERMYTRNSAPGSRVYGEALLSCDGIEYREWVPTRSKLAAYVRMGGVSFPFVPTSRVLYLGAASGTTASHVADICAKGTVYCVEISPRSFRDLVTVCETRRNMVPILSDATRPAQYKFVVERPDVVYQDIAQKNQAAILVKNMKEFGVKVGMLALKARSEDVTRQPSDIYKESASYLASEGFVVQETVELDPLEKDHAMLVVGIR